MQTLIAIVVIAALCLVLVLAKLRQRSKMRHDTQAHLGRPCPSCGQYVPLDAAICKHCYARIPGPKG
ncbi:hypothetical protein PIGHUM_00593 [Pigmentiphaga humi]|uniref:Uncharacterized protein n=1 Tax=Pigmentiphaga humi TaxID=2478468 RepID=A0A3P4AYT7_9BURK|nr:hypothetical protein [Pigmentiphaga humi]VCU68536.1 hypothetical protein PIGHUM_00593 [Pigmentiphaga humi]